MYRVFAAVLDAIAADDAVTVVVDHKRVAKHRTAFLVKITGVTGVVFTAVQTEVAVGANLKNGRHCKDRVNRAQGAEITAPGPALEKETEDDRAAGAG